MSNWKLCLGALVLSCNSWAVIPENGWWWNADESGRGFNLEVQNNLVFIASFGYDTNGAPMWIYAGGAMVGDRDFSGTLYRSTYGQCFGCPYVQPNIVPAGTVSLHFTSSQTAVLTVNGLSIAVKRFDFWGKNDLKPDAMMGQWSAVIGTSFDIFDGERINYNLKGINSANGLAYLGGARLGYSASTYPAIVQYFPSEGQWAALLDSSTSYYRLFIFNTTGFNRVEGNFWIYLKSSSPTGSGTFYQAFRTSSEAKVLTGSGPGSSKDAADADGSTKGFLERDERLFRSLSIRADAKALAEPSILKKAEELKQLLEAHQQR